MSQIIWDKAGERLYETGVKNGVLYVQDNNGLYPQGVAWNGLISVTESPSGAEPTPLYADDMKYLNLVSAEEFAASVEAYTYPDEFAACDGSVELATGMFIGQQARSQFGLAYRTTIGNDVAGESFGYKLHLIYGALAAPSERAYASINDAPEAITFSWELTTTPVAVTGKKPTASIVIDSTKVDSAKLAALELILYGNVGVDPRLPAPDEVASLLTEAAPSALALSTIVPADDATGVSVSANIVMTFNNEIAEESIVVMTDLGAIVAGAKTWDVTGKILTFNPTSDMDAATLHIVMINNVSDVYSQALATTTRTFTTA